MDTLKIAKQLLSRPSLSEMFPYYAYEKNNGVYILSQGVGFVFECSQTWGGTNTVDSLKGLYYQQFPVGTSIQVMVYASPTIEYLADSYVHLRETTLPGGELLDAIRNKKKFIMGGTKRSLLKGYDFRVRNFKHIVSCVVPCDGTPGGYEDGIRTIQKIKPIVYQALSTAHLNPKDMWPGRFLTVLSELINPSHSHEETQHYDERTVLS
jgi:hypothetical protein